MPAVYDSPAPILLIHALPPSWSSFIIGAGENLPTPHTLLTNDPVLRSRFLHLSRTTPNPGSLATTSQYRVQFEQGLSANSPQTDAMTSLLTRGPVSNEAIYDTSTFVPGDPNTRAINPSYQYVTTSAMAGGLDSDWPNLAIEPSVTPDVLTIQSQGNTFDINARVDSHHSLYQHDALSPVLPRADQYRRESSPTQCDVALVTESNPTEASDSDGTTSSDILFQGHSRNSSWDSMSSWL
ncbi:hypothetical protein PHLGIDRAFT_184283 [Phlebiopsis gigantea 11061_1 CR5-6]|uniref:Uncharacterized protein n=1 Tax=Phlebiopsis gigantea (strain 11061_1 CR5-6) TaxID=745531 RepID=A0A0C3S4U9_PHLG1|nr:hypothetical protein PHLGIDRAFT_184283 [Phlebiopsis gigantea 11061_1 CR5-6]